MWKGASFFDLLKNTPVASIPHKDITVIDSNETPINGFELLLKNKIQSAPVFDKAAGKFIGFLDIRDLISYTVFAFQNRDKVAYNSGTAGDVAVAQQSINHSVYAFKPVENVSTPCLQPIPTQIRPQLARKRNIYTHIPPLLFKKERKKKRRV
eukprot:TRINITY_DN1065_c0_g1_i2.p2 TRINITY_DN1065_c0_g1~~TRINITY_DN1065_c0_g1_i2.p2  ORF type:complete len:168 (-),score=40.78 TRINITY_DN1065_c0_g1_i2:829-1287(-)